MPVPKFWRVTWRATATEPAGSMDFTERARARGFAMVRRAAGFTVTIEAGF